MNKRVKILKETINKLGIAEKDISKKTNIKEENITAKLNGTEIMSLLDFHKIVNALNMRRTLKHEMIDRMFKN
ncbi:MAG: hypothetical protein SCJ93_04465 [Bacillota bacterium]|nr:hypothetical protein [Bacillota bacterium]